MEHELLACYEAIAAASGRMVDAARAADWERLVAAEIDCVRLVDRARELRACCAPGGSGEAQRMQALRKIMADDAEIRALMQPWLATLDGMLSGKAVPGSGNH